MVARPRWTNSKAYNRFENYIDGGVAANTREHIRHGYNNVHAVAIRCVQRAREEERDFDRTEKNNCCHDKQSTM